MSAACMQALCFLNQTGCLKRPFTTNASTLGQSIIACLTVQNGAHHQIGEYQVRGQEPKEEVQIYTWADATLRELTDLVKEVRIPAYAVVIKDSFLHAQSLC